MKTALINKLEQYGCTDMESTLERFIGDVAFYRSVLDQLVKDASFDELRKKLEEGNVSEAFDAAHTLKGIVSNCGITPMYDTVVRIVEPLRKDEIEGLMPICEELFAQKARLTRLLLEVNDE